MADENIRMSLLKRLAEQAMSDQAFRAVARDDLDEALERYNYHLNDRERALVGRFRTALEEAGVDLLLKDEIDLDLLFDTDDSSQIEHLLDGHGS